MLIYPLISYKKQFWLEDHYEEEAKVLTKELDAEREKRLKDGGKAAMDQVKKDLYDKNAQEYFFNLKITEQKKKKGDDPMEGRIIEDKDELAFKNQVYHRLFKRMETELEALSEITDSDNEASADEGNLVDEPE